MELVSERWYKGFTQVVAGLSVILLIGSSLTLVWPQFTPYGEKWGLSPLTLTLAAFLLIYILLLHHYLSERVGRYGSTLIVTFLFMTNVVNLLHSTGRMHSWYYIVWIAMVLMSGMFGAYTILAFCFLTLLYYLILLTDVPGQLIFDPFNFGVLLLVLAAGTVGYFGWRRMYQGEEDKRLAQLTGQLKSNKLQSEVLINSIADGIVLIGTDGKINLLNPAAAKMTEWTVAEATGIMAENVINFLQENGKPLNASQNPIKRALTKFQPVEEVLQLVGRQKRTLTVSIVVSPVVIEGQKQPAGVVAVIHDISTTRAEEKKRADFISTASHEMRTPVAAIEGYLALALNDKVSQIDQKARSYLEKAHTSTQHLGKLFQDLLTSAKAEDGRLVSNPVVVEMGSFLEQLVESLRFAAQKKGLLTDFTIGADHNNPNATGVSKVIKPLYYTHADPDRLREVITNLFDNAVKYTETGKISIGLTGNVEIVQFYVRDTGPGIPSEDIPHLFQKFYRVDNSSTRTIGGTGLGLFISRKIVELYNGRIWVESQVDKGSTFYINLPRLSPQKATELQKEEAQSASPLLDTDAILRTPSPASPAPVLQYEQSPKAYSSSKVQTVG